MGRRREKLSSLPLAAQRFRQRQEALLGRTYDHAWRTGRDSYEPDDDPPHNPPGAVAPAAGAGLGALLAARRDRPYRPPTEPDPVMRAAALAPGVDSARRMSIELAGVTPTADDMARADQEVTDGRIEPHEAATFATGLAVTAWISSNAWRLDAGASVAWAGEQHGYAQAATADGMQLEWQTEEDAAVCDDCYDLGLLPAMPIEDWPTMPGDGATQCDVGCRCSLEASASIELVPLDSGQQQVVDQIASTRLDALNP